ncbi:MAG: dTMP kinase [Zetaproteobacteria bacterium]|nr:MAG: dTMP kinase [Zetaproteobacteria bacterium]
MSGHFITFEGVDGCGKTTQRELTAAWLRTQGTEVVETFEPGASALGAEIRRLLLDGEHIPVPEAELMLFLADRAQHVHEVLRPALERGATVLCDRYTDSTRAYQLAGRQLNTGVLNTMLEVAELGLRPELTLWFDLPVSEALNRMRGRAATGEVPTRMDEERRSFHEAVRNGFSTIFEEEPGRVRRVDASGSVDEVQKRVRKVIVNFPGIAV